MDTIENGVGEQSCISCVGNSDEYGNGKEWIIEHEENNPYIIEMIDRDKINQMIILYWD